MKKVFSAFLYLLALSMLAKAVTGRWAFDPGGTGPGWVILDVVLAAACTVAAYGLWRRANWDKPRLARLRAACRGAHVVHAFVTVGRLLGLSGAVLLASAVASAHRWEELQQNWERSVPFGIPPEVRRTVLLVVWCGGIDRDHLAVRQSSSRRLGDVRCGAQPARLRRRRSRARAAGVTDEYLA